MKYRIFITHPVGVERLDLTDENIIPALSVRGFRFLKLNYNGSQRSELQGAPKFEGLCGPMWDGDGIRYECAKTYAELSA